MLEMVVEFSELVSVPELAELVDELRASEVLAE